MLYSKSLFLISLKDLFGFYKILIELKNPEKCQQDFTGKILRIPRSFDFKKLYLYNQLQKHDTQD